MRRIFVVLGISACLATTAAAPAGAGFIADHAIVHVGTFTSGSGNKGQQLVGEGIQATEDVYNASHVSGIAKSDGTMYDRVLWARGAAHTNPSGLTLLGATASAYGEPVQIQYPPAFGSMSSAFAAWTDIAYIDGPQHPRLLNFTFHLEGRLTLVPDLYPGAGGGSAGSISVGWSNQIVDFTKVSADSASSPLSLFEGVTVGPTPYVGPDFTNHDGRVTGDVTFQAVYDPTLGGYGFGIELYAAANAHYGSAASDFLNTLSLKAVTMPDGTAAPVHFDSGLQLSPVPEPASLGLLGLAALGLLAFGRVSARRGVARGLTPTAAKGRPDLSKGGSR